jgi:hypothetical protein
MLFVRRAQAPRHSCIATAVARPTLHGRRAPAALLLRTPPRHHASSFVAAAARARHASSLVAAAARARDAALFLGDRQDRARVHPPIITRAFATNTPDAYALLGVARGLTDRDYKVAYLRNAKEWHPDLRPDDPGATKKFQELSAAYEAIKDSGARAAYDARALSPDAGGFENPFTQGSPKQAAATWDGAWADAGALVEAAQAWWEEECAALDEDVAELSDAVAHRRLGDALDVVTRRSGLIVGVAVPSLILLRWPGAAVWVLRGIAPLATVVVGTVARVVMQNPRLLPLFGQFIRQVGGGLWLRAVGRARRRLADRERRLRRDEQRRRKYAQESWEKRRR